MRFHDEMMHLCCPITLELMTDPVIAADGRTYERQEIEKWLKKSNTSPITNEPLPSTVLIPNQLVKSLIREFEDKKR